MLQVLVDANVIVRRYADKVPVRSTTRKAGLSLSDRSLRPSICTPFIDKRMMGEGNSSTSL
jgi:hypothetical protein